MRLQQLVAFFDLRRICQPHKIRTGVLELKSRAWVAFSDGSACCSWLMFCRRTKVWLIPFINVFRWSKLRIQETGRTSTLLAAADQRWLIYGNHFLHQGTVVYELGVIRHRRRNKSEGQNKKLRQAFSGRSAGRRQTSRSVVSLAVGAVSSSTPPIFRLLITQANSSRPLLTA